MPIDIQDQDILDQFIVESLEHLADVENQILTIESDGVNINVDLVNTVFRAIHSIKGAAGFFGLTSIKNLGHSLENVLNLMRERQLVPTAPIADAMLKAADLIRSMIEDIHNSNDVDVSAHITVLDQIATGAGTAEAPASVENNHESAVENADHWDDSSNESREGHTEPLDSSLESTASPSRSAKMAAGISVASALPTKSSADSSIRVSVETLDRLMNLAGELVLGRNQLLQTLGTDEHCGLEAVAARINHVTSEMQDSIMQTRMQPIGNIFSRFTRVVRDLSASLKKDCNLVIEGQEVEVDKTIVEAIGDPLTHLIRNSVDHGLETPDVRITNGKPSGGTVLLRAAHQSGKVLIIVRDDGAGIDPEKVKRKALENGIITAEQAAQMSDRDAFRLIFAPGFSTADVISDVSGRGVGMDVVRTNIERLGGSVEIESRLGAGTTIQIMLPLTLAIIPSLIVDCSGQRFAVPQVSIAELVRVQPGEVETRIGRVNNDKVLRLRGSLLPLVQLQDALTLNTAATPTDADKSSQGKDSGKAMNIIVVESGQQRYGLVVDRLHDSEEIVVKPLGSQLRHIQCLSGATILGDGRIALILDVAGIASSVGLRQIHEQDDDTDTTCSGDEDRHSLLFFSNHPSEYFAVPMAVVLRIERINASQIDSVGGRNLLQYRGGTLPLINLDDHITAKQREDTGSLYVVVFGVAGREVGLIAPQLEDIRDVVVSIDDSSLKESGISGSFVLDEKTTRLIEISELTRTAFPEWFRGEAKRDEAKQEEVCTKTILLAEDSGFFRRQVTSYLEDTGFNVIGCEDGQIAWNTLQSGEQTFDLIVTDIEMPNMNGLEFCRHIKSDSRFSWLPVIALTSLASEADIAAGKSCGVDDYQVKLDRERLIASVRNYLNV